MIRRLQMSLIGLLALVLVGCAGMSVPAPETPREQLVAAEVLYGTLLDDVRSLATSGIIEPGSDTADTVATLLIEGRAALDAWQVDPDNPNLAVFAQKSLERLKLLLLRMSQESKANQARAPPSLAWTERSGIDDPFDWKPIYGRLA